MLSPSFYCIYYNDFLLRTQHTICQKQFILSSYYFVSSGRFNMNTRTKTKWIAETAIFIALLVSLQAVTKSMSQFVTGSMVNLVLVTATLVSGFTSGLTVAAISPFFAFMLGIGPKFFALVPFVAFGNIVLVLFWGIVCKNGIGMKNMVFAMTVGAVLKFLTLYGGIVKFAIPTILALPEKQAAVMGANFSWPQLVTALIGGFLAILITPTLKKALKK